MAANVFIVPLDISGANLSIPTGWTVTLTAISGGPAPAAQLLQPNGAVLFKSVATGTYSVSMTDGTTTVALPDVVVASSGDVVFGFTFTGFANPMTTVGDIIYGGAAGVATRLAASTNGLVLKLTAGLPAWATDATTAGVSSLGYGSTSANQNITATTTPGTDIVGLTVTCTPNGTTSVKVTVCLPACSSSSAGVENVIALQKDGAVVQVAQFGNTSDQEESVCFTYRDTIPTNAAHVYKVSAWVSAGTFSTIFGANPVKCEIYVEQMSQ